MSFLPKSKINLIMGHLFNNKYVIVRLKAYLFSGTLMEVVASVKLSILYNTKTFYC